MFSLSIPGIRHWDDANEEFLYPGAVEIELEHSLVSLSKWEEEFEKPFLGPDPKTTEETLGYVRSMTLTPGVPPEAYLRLTDAHILQVNEYIGAKKTATWFNEHAAKKTVKKEIVTSEVIYNWMINLNIPFDRETWHLNRLITLIRVANESNASKDSKANKMSPREIAQRNRDLNAQRLKQSGSTG